MKINGGFQSYQGIRSTAEKGQERISWGSSECPNNREPMTGGKLTIRNSQQNWGSTKWRKGKAQSELLGTWKVQQVWTIHGFNVSVIFIL